jgi:hypothetical protein
MKSNNLSKRLANFVFGTIIGGFVCLIGGYLLGDSIAWSEIIIISLLIGFLGFIWGEKFFDKFFNLFSS